MSLGHVLKLIRTNKGLNQKEMADMLGISQNYLSLIESEKKQPSSDRIASMAKNMKFTSNALVFAASDIPEELSPKDRKDFQRLQNNIISLLLFELTGELKQIA
jgi:transcriptional regulator with XRE-family HTH domain